MHFGTQQFFSSPPSRHYGKRKRTRPEFFYRQRRAFILPSVDSNPPTKEKAKRERRHSGARKDTTNWETDEENGSRMVHPVATSSTDQQEIVVVARRE